MYQFMIFSTFVLVNSVMLQECVERPINVVIDSTNLTTRADYDVFTNIVKNVTSRLQAVYVSNVSINVYPYRSNYPCRKSRASRKACIRKSNEIFNISSVLDSVTEYENLSSVLAYRKFENQPFCLTCAEHILKEQLMKESGNNAFGVILTVFPSLKKFIHSQLHKRYKNNKSYVLSLIYNSYNKTANKAGKQPLTSARIISRSYELVDKILSNICPERFDRRVKTFSSIRPNSSVAVVVNKTASFNQTIASSVNGNLNVSFTLSVNGRDENKTIYNGKSVISITPMSTMFNLGSTVTTKININKSVVDIQPSYNNSQTTISLVSSIKPSLEIDSSSSVFSSIKPAVVRIEASSSVNISLYSNRTFKKTVLFNSSVAEEKLMPSSVLIQHVITSINRTEKAVNSSKSTLNITTTVLGRTVSPKLVTRNSTDSPLLATVVGNVTKSLLVNATKSLLVNATKSLVIESSNQTKIMPTVSPTSSLLIGNKTKVSTQLPTNFTISSVHSLVSLVVYQGSRKLSNKSTFMSVTPTISITIQENPSAIIKKVDTDKTAVINATKVVLMMSSFASIRSTNLSVCTKCSATITSVLLQNASKILTVKTTHSFNVTQKTSVYTTPKMTKVTANVSKSVSNISRSIISTSFSFSILDSKASEPSITTNNMTLTLPLNASIFVNKSISSLQSSNSTALVFINGTKSISLFPEMKQNETKTSTLRITITSSPSQALVSLSDLLMQSFFSDIYSTSVTTYQLATKSLTVSSSLSPFLNKTTSQILMINKTFVKETILLVSSSISNSSNVTSLFTSTQVVIPLIPVKKVLDKITVFMQQNITKLHMIQKIWVKKFITNTSTLLDNIEENEGALVNKKSLNFLYFVERTTLKIGHELPVGKNITIKKKDLNVDMSAISPVDFTGYVFVPDMADNSAEKVELSPNVFKNSSLAQKKVSITTMFMKTIPAMRLNRDSFQDIGKVFTISLDVNVEHTITDLVTYSFKVPENNYSNYKCVFWNSTDWDTTGCVIANVSDTSVECQCNHMTTFSLLMQTSDFEMEEIHAYVLSIITYIGCSISIVGCVLLLLVYVMFGRLLKVSRNIIHMNLALAIAVSNALFISADSVHMYKGICLTVSIAMLYSYLASFFWMLVEGIHVYLLIVKVFKSPSMMKVYCIIGWIVPAVIVAIAGLKFHVNFTRDDFCWISTEGSVIWVFVGPVLSIVVINGVILITALSTSYKMAVAETDFLRLQQVARLTMLLMPIFGLTWVFGLLAINKQLIIFQYIFTIINSLQGVYIFICYCLLNNEVKQEFERIRRKYQYDSGNTVSSESGNFSVYDQLFHRRLKSVVSIDSSTMVRLTKYDAKLNRYDSVKTESTRASSTYSDTLTKRLNKDYSIELINLNDASNLTTITANDTQSMSSSVCPEEHEYGIKLNYEEVPLTNGHYSCGDFDTFKGKK